jgi:hypothetical protein
MKFRMSHLRIASAAAGAKGEMPPSTVTSGDLHVEAAFIRGINDERIELVRFLEG